MYAHFGHFCAYAFFINEPPGNKTRYKATTKLHKMQFIKSKTVGRCATNRSVQFIHRLARYSESNYGVNDGQGSIHDTSIVIV